MNLEKWERELRKYASKYFHVLRASTVILFIVFISIVLDISGCEQVSSPDSIFINPVDTVGNAFVAPITTIIAGPSDGQTITTDSVTFKWSGNNARNLFSYKYDTIQWTPFGTQTSLTLDYLDEGTHTFSVRSLHFNGTTIETNPPYVQYTVNAVNGPSLMFYPRRLIVANGQAFTYDINVVEVSLVYGAKLVMSYDPSLVNVTGAIVGSPLNTGGSGVMLPTIDPVSKTITLDIAAIGRTPKGIDGTGAIVVLQCTALATGVELFQFNAAQTALRDTSNSPIPINTLIGGRVEIQ
ncbi:MAG: cohesin domain-containing protein [Bacteroidota bacterium]